MLNIDLESECGWPAWFDEFVKLITQCCLVHLQTTGLALLFGKVAAQRYMTRCFVSCFVRCGMVAIIIIEVDARI